MSDQTKRCPYCSEIILATAKKCKHCGEWLTEKPSISVDSETFIKNALASRFEIKEEIGRGGMSVVYKAVQKSLNRVVALKILPQQFTHDQEFLERFHREAQSAAKLDHPNIVTIFDEGAENGVHYIAMKYIAGEDLHTRIQRQGALSVADMKQIVLPIADGLGYAHEAGMVHRDIKSANILIDKKGRAVLTDFGIARVIESKRLTQPGTVLGTPEYMSPEQAQGEKTDARSDIYSLGVVMYECLAGRLPFQSDNMLGTIHKITHEAPTAPRLIRSDIPEQVENVVLRCLAKEAADRYANCSEFADALEKGESQRIVVKKAVAAPEAEKPKPVPAKRETTPGAALPGWWKVAMGFVSLLLITVVLLFLRQLRQPPSATVEPGAGNAITEEQYRQQYGVNQTPQSGSSAIISAKKQKIDSLRNFGIEYIYVRCDTFEMGSDHGNIDEKPKHKVYVDDFYISKYEITNAEFCKFLNNKGNRSKNGFIYLAINSKNSRIVRKNDRHIPVSGFENHPVVVVSWYGAQAYCKWTGGRLPIEAEWEYAACGGEKSKGYKYSGSDSIVKVAWYQDNSKKFANDINKEMGTHPAGEKEPNELGIYDMSGNVWEWCSDWYEENYYDKSSYKNPMGPDSGTYRVVRGGSWLNGSNSSKTANRFRANPALWYNCIGFRVARSVNNTNVYDTDAHDSTITDSYPIQYSEGQPIQHKINELLIKAKKYVEANQLSSPVGNNALEIISEILSMDSDNTEALSFKQEIAEKYESWGDARLKAGDYGKAADYYRNSQAITASAGIAQKIAEAATLGAEKEGQENLLSRLGIDFVYVRGGTYDMGDLWGEGDSEERPVHRVTVSNFYISKCEITFKQYYAFCNATGRSKPSDEGWGRGQRPVINVSWNDAAAFCKWLSQKTAMTIRLPTEAEWEYAARERGKNVRFGNGRDIADPSEINFNGSSRYKKSYSVTGAYRRKTTPVGSFRPNSLGLYDMSGNVCEWCADWYNNNYYRNSWRNNPKGPSSGAARVVRGGSWDTKPRHCRTTLRLMNNPAGRYNWIGFRVARSVR